MEFWIIIFPFVISVVELIIVDSVNGFGCINKLFSGDVSFKSAVKSLMQRHENAVVVTPKGSLSIVSFEAHKV